MVSSQEKQLKRVIQKIAETELILAKLKKRKAELMKGIQAASLSSSSSSSSSDDESMKKEEEGPVAKARRVKAELDDAPKQEDAADVAAAPAENNGEAKENPGVGQGGRKKAKVPPVPGHCRRCQFLADNGFAMKGSASHSYQANCIRAPATSSQ